jgi:hypothetical protein
VTSLGLHTARRCVDVNTSSTIVTPDITFNIPANGCRPPAGHGNWDVPEQLPWLLHQDSCQATHSGLDPSLTKK